MPCFSHSLVCLSHSKTHTNLSKVGFVSTRVEVFKAKGVFIQHTNYVMRLRLSWNWGKPTKPWVKGKKKESNTNHKTHEYSWCTTCPPYIALCWPFWPCVFFSISLQSYFHLDGASSLLRGIQYLSLICEVMCFHKLELMSSQCWKVS
jgi:hypothetical protein